MNEQATTVREGDVFRFVYNEAAWEKARSGLGHGDLNWCFDGQLEAQADGRLCDTYWRPSNDCRTFTLAEAEAKGTLTFVCNLNDVDLCTRHYAKGDWFNLTYHHGHRKRFAVRKGAQRDRAVMLAAIEERIREVRATVEAAQRGALWEIERLAGTRARVESGDLTVNLSWVTR